MRAKKSLGQNFLTSKAVVSDIITTANLSTQDAVLEIGPGKGFLTEELLKKAGEVIVIEKDNRLVEYLEERFAKEVADKKLVIIHDDVLDLDIKKLQSSLKSKRYVLVANIPYYITGQILRMFLESESQPEKMILMVQKEVAKRIVANDGKESILSVSVKAYGTPHYIKKVPARYFNPKPKVDSAILLIDNISKKIFPTMGHRVSHSWDEVDPIAPVAPITPVDEERKFFELMKTGFAHKRKMLLNNLSSYTDAESVFCVCKIQQKVRAEELSVKDWICIAKNIK